MDMRRVEEAFLLWKLLGFRDMIAPHPDGPKSAYLRRLWRLQGKACKRYFRRKRAVGGLW